MHPTKRINFSDFIEEKKAAADVIELPDGTEIKIPPAMLWPDEAFDALGENRTKDAVELILGDQHAAFVEAGGNWRILNAIVQEFRGLEAGESAASSES